MNEEDDLPLSAPEYFRVGGFLIRPRLKAIRPFHGFDAPSSAEKDRRLPDKPIAVLLKLAEHPRVVFSRERLLDEVWGEDREAYDRVLDNAISELRKAFGDNARNPRYIETITKQGYRLIAQVEWPEPEAVAAEEEAIADADADADAGAGETPADVDGAVGEDVEIAPVDAITDPEAQVPVEEARQQPPDGSQRSAEDQAVANVAQPQADPRAHPTESPTAASPIRFRRYYGLFAMLALVMLGALVAYSMRMETRTLWIAQVPNQTGDAAYDRLTESIRQRLEQSGCSSPGFEETDLFFLASVRIEGRTEFDGGTIRLSAAVTGGGSGRFGSAEHRVEAIGTAGRQPEWLVGIEEGLDPKLCEMGAACHCARLARQRLQEQRLAEADIGVSKALEMGEESISEAVGGNALHDRSIELWWLDLAIEIAVERAEWQRARILLKRAAALATAGTAGGEDSETWQLRLERREAQVDGRVADESRILKALRQLQPNEPQWALDLGRLELEHNRNCGESHAWLDKALRLGDERSLLAKVDVDAVCGHLERAPTHLSEFLDRFPGSLAGELRSARLQRLEGRFQDPKERLGREREYAPMQLELARLERAQGFFELAQDEIEAYRRLATWPRGQHDAAIERGLASLLAGDAEAALQAADDAQQAWLAGTVPEDTVPEDAVPEDAVPEDTVLKEEASTDFVGPGLSVEALWLRGWAELLEGREEEALGRASKIKEQSRAQGSRRGFELAYHLDGLVAARRGDWESAVSAFYDALKLHPREEPLFRLELARAFIQLKESARASEELTKILQHNPRHAPALCELGLLLEIEGDAKAARERYGEAFAAWNEQPEDRSMQECLERQRRLDTSSSAPGPR